MRPQVIRALALLFFVAIGRGLLAQAPGSTPIDESPTGNSGALKPQIQTGGSYDAHSGNATRIVPDLHVPGALGVYGLDFTRYWNSNHNDYDDPNAEWPMDFGASGWSHSWHWRAEYVAYTEQAVDGGETLFFTAIIITFPDGHTTKYKIVRSDRAHGTPPNVAPPDPRLGPPYTDPEINSGFPHGGMGVHDHLCKMDPNGTDFWLCRADGGAVHFTGGSGNYYATEVYDPQGLKTTLRYNAYGDLYQVEQEGGKLLNIKWSLFNPGGWRVITKVEAGGTAGYQRVSYTYERLGYFLVLSGAHYADDPAPGQTTSSRYSYGTCYGEETEPCDTSGQVAPMLKRADDPRYEGAMTKIRYTYRGEACPPPLVRPWEYPCYVSVQPYAIATEKSDGGELVSQFTHECRSGVREEFTGLGGRRRFYFGPAAQTGVSAPPPEGPFSCRGFQLGKLTDFTTIYWIQSGVPCPPGVDCHRQNYSFGNPRQIWDGRNIMTEEIAVPGDASGQPGRINYLDGSHSTYDRINPGNSAPRDNSRIPNTYNHWLFQKEDERGQPTTYTRDARRRVTRIDYPDNSVETFEYDNNDPNGLGQVTKHKLPSEAIETYEYDPYTHLLVREYNSIDGWEARKEYEYDSLGRVAMMTDGRARASGAQFTVKMTYNGRHKVTSVEYPPTGGAQHPTVRYEYDSYGNCTVITDEMGHRKEFTYDSYRRCTSYIEWLFGPGPDCNNIYSRKWNWYYDRYFDDIGLVDAAAHTSKQWRVQVEPVFNSDGHRRLSAQKFDRNDRVIEGVTGMVEASDGSWHVVEGTTEVHHFSYDENGQKSSFTDARLRLTTYDYDVRNRPWKTNEYPYPNTGVARTTETLYDPTGNKLSVKFPDEEMQHWENYDAFGQPRRFIDERDNPTDLIYCWGPMKKLYKVTTHRAMDGGETEHQLTEFGYDLMGRPIQTLFPDGSNEFGVYQFGQVKIGRRAGAR